MSAAHGSLAAPRWALLCGNFAIGCGVMVTAGVLNDIVTSLQAAGVWRALPSGIRPGALSLADWRTVFTHPVLMAVVAVTAMSSAGQFTLFSYFAPYYRQVLGAGAAQVSLLFLWFGALGLVGNVLLTRHIDRVGAARAVALTLACMALSLLAWPLATGFASALLVTAPWALGCFSSNSAQQARLALAAPALASALVSLNSSAMYFGQFAGSASGGAMIAAAGFGGLSWVALGWMSAALLTSLWAARRMDAPGRSEAPFAQRGTRRDER